MATPVALCMDKANRAAASSGPAAGNRIIMKATLPTFLDRAKGSVISFNRFLARHWAARAAAVVVHAVPIFMPK